MDTAKSRVVVTPLYAYSKQRLLDFVAQISKPAVLPTSKSAGRAAVARAARLETRDTPDLEVLLPRFPPVRWLRSLGLAFPRPRSFFAVGFPDFSFSLRLRVFESLANYWHCDH
jgi:hypothetical protein